MKHKLRALLPLLILIALVCILLGIIFFQENFAAIVIYALMAALPIVSIALCVAVCKHMLHAKTVNQRAALMVLFIVLCLATLGLILYLAAFALMAIAFSQCHDSCFTF